MCSMEIRFSQSARKHRIGRRRALEVIASCEPEALLADGVDPDRLRWVGTDQRGLELEIVGVWTPLGILIIHVMPMNFRRRGGRQ